MLILTRKRGEQTDLLDAESNVVLATITFLEMLPNGTVRLGFDALPSIKILRDNAVRRDNGTEEGEVNGNR